jgi:hypothetical protein
VQNPGTNNQRKFQDAASLLWNNKNKNSAFGVRKKEQQWQAIRNETVANALQVPHPFETQVEQPTPSYLVWSGHDLELS